MKQKKFVKKREFNLNTNITGTEIVLSMIVIIQAIESLYLLIKFQSFYTLTPMGIAYYIVEFTTAVIILIGLLAVTSDSEINTYWVEKK